ncbi:MAG: transcription factor [Desulfuromonadaceae bacterium]|nr:transcription factor [Desulfuromonadaceae bacterium]MDD5106182.1 transcription factor [Desulfuromonadaceae bacterium]
MFLLNLRTFLFIIALFLVSDLHAAEKLQRVKSAIDKKHVPAVVPVSILSIIPAKAEPGMKVSLSGAGFGEEATVFLGSTGIPARVTGTRQADFTVPQQLEAGLYALYLKRSDGTIGRTYNFTVLPLRPVLTRLTPDQISSCSAGKEREVIAVGGNFRESSLLFFDGAALASTVLTTETISFSVPDVAGGLHQVLVKNAPENSSVPLNLAVETKPEIVLVSTGNEHVNYYELVITGKNFSQNSSLFVDGVQIGGRGEQDMTEREKLVYVDCTKLIYLRHPYSPVNKDFRLQVMNPGGEGSQVITVTAP